jgi:hypothetical protein
MSMVGQPYPQILESKLRRPWVRPGIVSRAALVDRLLASHHVPVVCVVAPAGYGKTTLLSQWAEQRGRAAWVSLDERDNDPEILLACAAAALNRVEAIDPELLRTRWLGGASIAATAVTRLAGAMSGMKEPVVLVLDHVDLGGAAAGEPVDHLHPLAVGPAGQPVQHGRGGGLQAWLPGWGGQLHQRHQPPVGPRSTCCRGGRRSRRPAAGRPAAPGLGPLQELGRVGGCGRTIPILEQLPAGQVADGRLVAGEQPRQGGRGWTITRAVHGGVIAEPDANRQWPTRTGLRSETSSRERPPLPFQRYGKRWAVARKRRSSVSNSSLLASISSATGTGEVASMQYADPRGSSRTTPPRRTR